MQKRVYAALRPVRPALSLQWCLVHGYAFIGEGCPKESTNACYVIHTKAKQCNVCGLVMRSRVSFCRKCQFCERCHFVLGTATLAEECMRCGYMRAQKTQRANRTGLLSRVFAYLSEDLSSRLYYFQNHAHYDLNLTTLILSYVYEEGAPSIQT